MLRTLLLILLLTAGTSSAHENSKAAEKNLWLVVTTEQLAPSLKPLADRRRDEGLEVILFLGQPSEALAKNPNPAYVLLVGDVASPGETADKSWQIASRQFPLYRWSTRQREMFFSDSMWGDLDNDGIPDVPVGRLPARTGAEVELMVRKIVAYEERPWSTDDLRFPTWIGTPLATPVFNRMATGLLVQQLKTNTPRWSEISLICGDPHSAFCGWPPEQAATFNHWLQRGGLFATVGAHGSEYSWLSMMNEHQSVTYRVRESDGELQQGKPTCPLVVLTCKSGNFSAKKRCVTEAMILAPGGPVAAVGATTESHPLPNCFTVRGLQASLALQPDRLGDMWLQGLRRGYAIRDFLLEPLLKDLEGSIEDEINVATLRRDQLRMYALMGDPATKIRSPKKLAATLIRDSDGWRWQVQPPQGATALHIHFRSSKPVLPNRPPNIDQLTATALHQQANNIFAYHRLPTLTAKEPWQGTLSESGELRLVAMTPDGWYVAVLQTKEE